MNLLLKSCIFRITSQSFFSWFPWSRKKLQGWDVNYTISRNLPTFIIENEKEEPILFRCSVVDEETSICDIDDYLFLKDNKEYNIYYSENIYETEKDIDEE